jgi:hypothetical protein
VDEAPKSTSVELGRGSKVFFLKSPYVVRSLVVQVASGGRDV